MVAAEEEDGNLGHCIYIKTKGGDRRLPTTDTERPTRALRRTVKTKPRPSGHDIRRRRPNGRLFSLKQGLSFGLTPVNITANINSIALLNGSNFKLWKENREIVLGVMDLDLALREDCPPPLIDKSTSDDKREKERWEKSNHIAIDISFMKSCRLWMFSKITRLKLRTNSAKGFKALDLTVVVSTIVDMMAQARSLVQSICTFGGCPVEARPYRPKEKKLDSRTDSILDLVQDTNKDNVREPPIQEIVSEKQALALQEPIPLRRSTKERRNAFPDDYIVFLQEHEVDIGVMKDDPIKFCQAIEGSNSQKWIDAMNEEIKSMKDNDVWDLVPLLEGAKFICCKWIVKTKRDSKGVVERYKACLVAKGFTQKEGIDYKETFSPISSNDHFRIIMALVAYFNLELH
ncbi:Retrovirus-related Pol polyprotein from transposon TNT 1-94 [Melia azedarach]|uniref:Retrovirus-related Pol polyprotein from transposon TNT 1-94 n=1 Tax=Melia azedarach TaxID=155640 RepID=A0ACC1Y653_MELAZ|nr:Retrovirus-related Pol polyprotein from transposon TNT 1-94 [Melia azedarach]